MNFSLVMNYESLRVLFESLCDYLAHEGASPLRFQAAFGFETPAGVEMVFVFSQPQLMKASHFAVLFRFGLSHPFSPRATPISGDESIALIERVWAAKDGFQELFS